MGEMYSAWVLTGLHLNPKFEFRFSGYADRILGNSTLTTQTNYTNEINIKIKFKFPQKTKY